MQMNSAARLIVRGFYTPPGSNESKPFEIQATTDATPEQLEAVGIEEEHGSHAHHSA